ncbi:unnamed protein product [Caenorhabditis sp. 36 PRJEB53466]|nr:unnamed protein product [Caenorhabditis sp. 36 PRJEB53466]
MSTAHNSNQPITLRSVASGITKPFRWLSEKLVGEPAEMCRLIEVIGRGEFGRSILAQISSTMRFHTFKVMKKGEEAMTEKRMFEVLPWSDASFLVHIFSCFETPQSIVFNMEYTSEFLKLRLEKGPIRSDSARFYGACVLMGVQFLHDLKICHNNLKLEAVFLDLNGYAKIGGLGNCVEGMGAFDSTTSVPENTKDVAPEIMKGYPHTRAVDWWSLGVLIKQMLTGARATEEETPVSDAAFDLITKLLAEDPKDRLGYGNRGAEEIKNEEYFKGCDWHGINFHQVMPSFRPEIRFSEDVDDASEQRVVQLSKENVVAEDFIKLLQEAVNNQNLEEIGDFFWGTVLYRANGESRELSNLEAVLEIANKWIIERVLEASFVEERRVEGVRIRVEIGTEEDGEKDLADVYIVEYREADFRILQVDRRG